MRNAASAGKAAQVGMPFQRANPNPITHSSTHPASTVARKPPDVFTIALILTSVFLLAPVWAQEAPPNLARLVAQRETETEKERSEFTYRQSVTIDELDDHGATPGTYHEVLAGIFSPQPEGTS